MSDLDATLYCLSIARERCQGPAAVYWQAVVRACERILSAMQGRRT